MTIAACPICNAGLRGQCAVSLLGVVTAEYLDNTRAGVDLQLVCGRCNFGWTAVVPFEAFFANPIPEAL